MATFHETMNKVQFRGIAGWVRTEADLWTLRDILFELQTDIMEWGVNTDLKLKEQGYDLRYVEGRNPIELMVNALEHDIQLIETYCGVRDIPRTK